MPDLATLRVAARNDLEEAAISLVPEIGELLHAMAEHSDFARMSGSGATCFAMFDQADDAKAAEEHLRTKFCEKWPHYWTMTAQPRIAACGDAASGPERAAS